MCEIKFRKWDGNAMVYMPGVYLEGAAQFFDLLHPTDELMQFTGLKDKNGKEIFEGDVLEFSVFDCNGLDTQYKGVVKFAEGEWQIWESDGNEYYGSDGAFPLWWSHQQDDEMEVIGNIHENPELLITVEDI